jgi:hypothetical protein
MIRIVEDFPQPDGPDPLRGDALPAPAASGRVYEITYVLELRPTGSPFVNAAPLDFGEYRLVEVIVDGERFPRAAPPAN